MTAPATLEARLRSSVKEQLDETSGHWRGCSGCHELNEGHATGLWSDVFKCHLGLGCSECGGIGAVWDNTDWEGFAKWTQDHDRDIEAIRAVLIEHGVTGYHLEMAAAEIANLTPPATARTDGQMRAVLDMTCNEEMGTAPDCLCPHEHWHVGFAGCCLDVHLEEDGSAHIIFYAGDQEAELTVRGIASLDDARRIAFAWVNAPKGEGK